MTFDKFRFLLLVAMTQHLVAGQTVVTRTYNDSEILSNCNLNAITLKSAPSCFSIIQYLCAGSTDLNPCQRAYDLILKNSAFSNIGSSCPAWKFGPQSSQCSDALQSVRKSGTEQYALAIHIAKVVLANPSLAPCYPSSQTVCNWGTIKLPPAPGSTTKVSGTAGFHLARYLDIALISKSVAKRAILNALVASDTTTQAYLNTCSLDTATTSNDFLAGCLAGLARYCQRSTLRSCRDYYETVYSKSIYAPIVKCLPWMKGPRSQDCVNAMVSVCSQYGPTTSTGAFDQNSGPCGFATFSQKTVFQNSKYCPQV